MSEVIAKHLLMLIGKCFAAGEMMTENNNEIQSYYRHGWNLYSTQFKAIVSGFTRPLKQYPNLLHAKSDE